MRHAQRVVHAVAAVQARGVVQHVVPAHARAQDHGQLVRGPQACCTEGALLHDARHAVVAQLEIGPGHLAVPFEVVAHGAVGVGVAGRMPALARPAGAERQLVLAPEQLQRPGQRRIHGLRGGIGGNLVGQHVDAQAADRVHHAVGCHADLHVARLAQPAGRQVHLPAIAEAVLEFGKHVGAVVVPVRPARRRVERGGEVRAAAILEEQRDVAEAGPVGARLHVVNAQAGHGARAQVGLDDAVQAAHVAAVVVHMGPGVLRHGHHAGAHAAVFGQRRGDVAHAAQPVMAADGRLGRGLEGLGGPLAHQIDHGRRIARAREQACGALDHLHAVIDGAVGQRGRVLVGRVHGVGHAIELEILDGIAARVEGGALAVVAAHGDAGRLLQHLGQAGQALVVHELARDHADRLRRLALRQAQPCGRAGLARGVGARAFGDRAALGSGRHVDRGQRGTGGRHGRHLLHAPQRIAAAGLAHGLPGGAGQQRLEGSLHRVAAAQARAALSGRLLGREDQGHAGLGGRAAQGGIQRAGSDVIAALGLGQHGGGHERDGQRQRGAGHEKGLHGPGFSLCSDVENQSSRKQGSAAREIGSPPAQKKRKGRKKPQPRTCAGSTTTHQRVRQRSCTGSAPGSMASTASVPSMPPSSSGNTPENRSPATAGSACSQPGR